MATIHDVAKSAGVSVATVSRYFNNGYVSDINRKKIDLAIQQLDYKVDAVARALSKKSSKTIGLVIPSITNPFFPELAQRIEDRTTLHGYKLVLCNANSFKKEIDFINMLSENYADGIITATGNCSDIYKDLKIPVVSIDRMLTAAICHVDSDNYEGGSVAIGHLWECGCRNILFLRTEEDYPSLTDRQNGIIYGAKRLQLNIHVETYREDRINDCLNGKIANYDGIIAWNDMTAITILNYCYRNRIKVPEDVMVIGYDNIFISGLINPLLTTISQNIAKMGEAAINEMLKMIEGNLKFTDKVRLPVELIIRETTRKK